MKLAQAKIVVLSMTIAGVLCVIAMGIFLIIPTLKEIKDLAVEVVQAERDVQAQYTYRKQLSDTIKRLKQSKTAVGALATQFVRQGDELTFITAIEGIGEADNVQTKLSLTADGGGGGVPEFNHGFAVEISGTFRDVMHGLVDLERLPELTVLHNVTVRSGSGGLGQESPLSISVNGHFASPPNGL